MADRGPGPDGDFSHDIDRDDVRRYVEAAERHGALLLLDIQPGRSDFLDVAKRWEWALRHPHVGLALDPEWRVGPRQVPAGVIGSVRAGEVNRVSSWLSDLAVAHDLPEKLFVLHQFRTAMIDDIERVAQRPRLALVQHVDGFGTRAEKLATYGVVARPQQFTWASSCSTTRTSTGWARPRCTGSGRPCGSSASSEPVRRCGGAGPDTVGPHPHPRSSVTPSADLDARDPLAPYRDLFVGAEHPLVYFDGNSLGRPLRVTGPRLAAFVEEEWGGRLIRGWDERWFDLPEVIGDDLGRVALGARPGQTVVGDSTTVLLYKAMRAAVGVRPGRTEIVLDRDNFPTDRYVADGVARECGLTLRWIEVDTAGGVEAEALAAVVGPQTALVLLSHVAYRSAHLAEASELTRIAHDVGALVLWDLSHSAGSVPVELDAWDVDLAVGCTYKYLNGGPGAPAFVYVAERLLDEVTQPVQGWMGATDPFLMGPRYRPAAGVRRMLSGTPPVIGMLAMQDMLALVEQAGMDGVRAKSVALTEHAIALADARLPGVTVASPRDSSRRGGHVTLNHPAMRDVTTALWAQDVIPDYRDPHGLRLGLSPLSTSYAEVETGLESVRVTLERLTA